MAIVTRLTLLQQCFYLLLLEQEVLLKEEASPPEGFRFNCGNDICVYPRHFCNVRKQQCMVCTISVCNELNVSSQCHHRCDELKGNVKTLQPEDQWSGSPSDYVTGLSYKVNILLVLMVLLLACVLFFIVKYVISCITRHKQPDGGSQGYEPVSRDDPHRQDPTAPPQCLDSPRAHSTGSSVSVYQPSSSSQAGNYSTQPDYGLMSETISESPEEVPPGAGHNQLHSEVHNRKSFSHSFEEFPPLQSTYDTSSTYDDHDATALNNESSINSPNETSNVYDNMDYQSPQQSGPSCNAFGGIAEAYVPRVPSAKSIISSASRGSDSGNYSSANSSETESTAMKKRQTLHRRDTLTADV